MNTIKLEDITIGPRQPRSLGDIPALADSIRRNGLIYPIVLDENNTLISGFRRVSAYKHLGLESIEFIYRKELKEEQKAEIEFEENFFRENLTWQENCLGILDIYEKKKRAGALAGLEENWSFVIAQMFGMAVGKANLILIVARRLRQELSQPEEKRRWWGFSSPAEAYRLGHCAEKEDELNRQLAKMQAPVTTHQQKIDRDILAEVEQVSKAPDGLADARAKYESNPLNITPFNEYWKEKETLAASIKNTVYLGNTLIRAEAISYMSSEDNKNRFDHIITDPPYAEDMDMLEQQNQGMVGINTVAETHQVKDNEALLEEFFPAAWKCTKERAFVITFCDTMVWERLHKWATKAGFSVQRWAYIWKKVNQTMNNAAGYNTTKDYELAMICHKPGATLAEKRGTSFTEASNVEAKKATGHPFAKPYELTKDLCQMVSIEGQTILEPFAGGGSMVIQMLKMKRNVVALEMTDHHFASLVENVKREHYLKLNPQSVFK